MLAATIPWFTFWSAGGVNGSKSKPGYCSCQHVGSYNTLVYFLVCWGGQWIK